MRTNTSSSIFQPRTHEGAPSRALTPFQELKRTASACLLFENTFYESGVDVATRIESLVQRSPLIDVLKLAQELRHSDGLRHAPLWMLNACLSHPQRNDGDNSRKIAAVIANVAGSRADLLGELLAMYWKSGKRPLAKALKNGLADALRSLSSYAMQKYAARGPIRLRDVLFLTHAKPRDEAQADWFKMLADDTLPVADTWETQLSGGADKREVFTRLLQEKKLGALAVLRNLRNMTEAGVDRALIVTGLKNAVAATRFPILPFQFIAAARVVPTLESTLDATMLQAVHAGERDLPEGQLPETALRGLTLLLVDVSGSMSDPLGSKSTLNRSDAARALAILVREVCEEVLIADFDTSFHVVPDRRGMALADAIRPARGGGTFTGEAVAMGLTATKQLHGRVPDRVVIITDEQSHSSLPALPSGTRGYVMNVASNRHGIAWGPYTTVSGFSENMVKFIAAAERNAV